jgi:adenosylcobalamin-dependent ribonucleoside-triphosphate reductase
MFKLKDGFINKYKTIKPPFGFNGLGEITYYRTYSRLKEDGTNEQWYETIRRVVEGTYTIQKEHILEHTLGWEEDKAHESAEEMYDRMFNMKFLPPGRGLWAMGSPIITDKKLFAALNNCAFVSTETIDKDKAKPFAFMMDMSMLGVGTGFDVKGANKLRILKPIGTFNAITIPDTREGWVESLKSLLNAFFEPISIIPIFDYSQIREKGLLIKTFGGKSSGSEPLKKLHTQIKELLFNRIDDYLSATDITDIMNMIGVCVVSGNVRRTAQIVFGEPDDEEYLKLKDYKWNNDTSSYKGSNSKRSEWGWASNNSIFAKIGMDYKDVAKQTASNGEPGYAWLDNMQGYSRMNNGPDYKDHRVLGGNPCLEQSLESYEMCCLVEVFPTKHDNMKDFLRTLKFAYLYAKTVTLGTVNWPETNRVQLRNRRIGTSITGVAQFVEKNGIDTLKEWLTKGYDTIQKYDEIYSDWLAIPKSIKTTSIKPSGSISLLPGVTPGMHYPESNYYIRRIRIANNSDLLEGLRNAGYVVELDVMDPNNTSVVEFPVSIEGIRTINEVSIWEQAALAAFLQKYWADNQVSCTITFKEHEKDQIEHVLNYYQYQLKGVSFLPKTDKGVYAQMPYESISKEEYEEMLKNIREFRINVSKEEAIPERFCNNDTCEL